MRGSVRAAGETRGLVWAIAGRCMPGELQSGDAAVVVEREDAVIIAVVDGLGHGDEAAAAASLATQTIEEDPAGDPALLLQRCHDRLKRTRGAAVSIATVDGHGSLAWAGIGNVDAHLVRATNGGRESVLLRGGIVGYQLPSVRVSRVAVGLGDHLVFATDGIHSRYSDELPLVGSPSAIAETVLAEHARATDDALVLVARMGGGPS